ncbi:hypothetical protein CLAIMM_04645 [Cladophialophora immunda]|nr:hypothetical protein CLAIMM_04645 [Cladophialophora immunda]
MYLQTLFGLRGKTALVTGGTRGIGAALAVGLASAGADIILLQRDVDKGRAVCDEIAALGRKCTVYRCDLGKREDVLSIIPLVTRDNPEVDILVNCAAISCRSSSHEMPDDKWDDILQVNVTTIFQLCRAMARHWLQANAQGAHSDKKKIINLASILTFSGGVNVAAYTTSKGAVGQLTKALNNEWMGSGICVNAIAPGYIQTDMTQGYTSERIRMLLERTPAGRWGLPADIVGGVIYLASKASDFVGGEIHLVDGGFTAR